MVIHGALVRAGKVRNQTLVVPKTSSKTKSNPRTRLKKKYNITENNISRNSLITSSPNSDFSIKTIAQAKVDQCLNTTRIILMDPGHP